MRLNYSDYRYFGVSALGAEPDYAGGVVAPGGVQPHRVEDPVLWLLSKTRTVPAQHDRGRVRPPAVHRLPGRDRPRRRRRVPGAGPVGRRGRRRRPSWRLAGCCTTPRTRGSCSGARSGTSRSGSRTHPRPATGQPRAATWEPRLPGPARATTSPIACSPGTRTCTARPGPHSYGGRRSGVPRRGTPRTARSSMTRRPWDR